MMEAASILCHRLSGVISRVPVSFHSQNLRSTMLISTKCGLAGTTVSAVHCLERKQFGVADIDDCS